MSSRLSPRLLVVDDDLGVIAAYRHVLEGSESARARGEDQLEDELFGQANDADSVEFDWRVHFVDQGEDAVAAVRESIAQADPFSVVFLDVRMPPGIDGYETARRIRLITPHVHIVFVSAYSDYSDDELLLAAGPAHMTSSLPKPVWPQELKSAAITLCRDVQMRARLKGALKKKRPGRMLGT